uniref:Uncharacterized protein n=2 Tax=Caenorhabditis japonica TaxID=281687 RepID=A0A8R1DTF6_CAEJA
MLMRHSWFAIKADELAIENCLQLTRPFNMFLNHRPLLVLLLFLAASPVDVVSRILYADNEYPDIQNGTLPHLDPMLLDLNPLHLLCPVCSLLQLLLGGILGGLLGGNVLKQLGIFVCSLILSTPIQIPFVPNILCTAVFEIIFMIGKKAGSGLCPLLLLCPLPKNAKTTKAPILTAEDEYEQRIVDIIENRDSANLSPQMEYFYKDLLDYLPMQNLKGTGVEEPARHVLRNLVAAIQYHVAHREEYLKAVSISKI